jgi:hypothetical protein
VEDRKITAPFTPKWQSPLPRWPQTIPFWYTYCLYYQGMRVD